MEKEIQYKKERRNIESKEKNINAKKHLDKKMQQNKEREIQCEENQRNTKTKESQGTHLEKETQH